MSADAAKPFLLLLRELSACRDPAKGALNSLEGCQKWLLLPSGVLHHRDNIYEALVIAGGVGLFQVVHRKAFGRDNKLLPQLSKGVGTPALRPVQQDLDGFDGKRVLAHEAGEGSEIILRLIF